MRAMAFDGRGRRCGALIVVLMSAHAAYAQGFYYKEIRKDDRIYVFNIAAEAEQIREVG